VTGIRFLKRLTCVAKSYSIKKAGVAEYPKAFNHAGLLFNEPPGGPDCSLFSHPTICCRVFGKTSRNWTANPPSLPIIRGETKNTRGINAFSRGSTHLSSKIRRSVGCGDVSRDCHDRQETNHIPSLGDGRGIVAPIGRATAIIRQTCE
jgi:hypothetical protein